MRRRNFAAWAILLALCLIEAAVALWRTQWDVASDKIVHLALVYVVFREALDFKLTAWMFTKVASEAAKQAEKTRAEHDI